MDEEQEEGQGKSIVGEEDGSTTEENRDAG